MKELIGYVFFSMTGTVLFYFVFQDLQICKIQKNYLSKNKASKTNVYLS